MSFKINNGHSSHGLEPGRTAPPHKLYQDLYHIALFEHLCDLFCQPLNKQTLFPKYNSILHHHYWFPSLFVGWWGRVSVMGGYSCLMFILSTSYRTPYCAVRSYSLFSKLELFHDFCCCWDFLIFIGTLMTVFLLICLQLD